MSANPPDGGLTWVTGIGADDRDAIDWIAGTVLAGAKVSPELEASEREALDVLQRYAGELEPFALYLRSFEFEAARGEAPAWAGPEVGYLEFLHAPTPVERALAEAFRPRLAVVTVAHPGNRFRRPDPHWLPRFSVPDAQWREVVAQLVQRASIIFVELIHLTPGLREELELLARSGIESRVVVVLDDGASDVAARRAQQGQWLGAAARPEPVDARDPALQPFRRVVPASAFSADAAVLADLLAEAAFVRALAPAQRQARNQALGAADAMAALLEQRRVVAAALAGLDARAALLPLGDAISLVGVCCVLALATHALEEHAKTHDAIGWLLEAAAPLDAPTRAALRLRYRLLAHLPADDPEQRRALDALFGAAP